MKVIQQRTTCAFLLGGVFLAFASGVTSPAVCGADTDSVFANQVIVAGPPWPDSFGVPVLISMDDTLQSLSIWLRAELSGEPFQALIPSSFSPNSSLFKVLPDGYWGPSTYLPEANALGFHWTSLTPAGLVAEPNGTIGTVFFTIVDPNVSVGTVLDLDTINIPFQAPSKVTVKSGSGTLETDAPFIQIGDEIIFGQTFECCDTDGSGSIDISDAVYLVDYIFANGAAPLDNAAGDCDCSGAANITDAVFLVNYIFAGGAPPCSMRN